MAELAEAARPAAETAALESLSLKELKALIAQAGLSSADCLDRSDLHARAREAQERIAGGYTMPPPTPKVRRQDAPSNTPSCLHHAPFVPIAAGSAHHIRRFVVQG